TDPAQLLDVCLIGAAGLALAHEVLGVDRDRRQWVVELVHDARRELAEGREALGTYDLLLEQVDLGLVLTDRDACVDRTGDRARRGARRPGAALMPPSCFPDPWEAAGSTGPRLDAAPPARWRSLASAVGVGRSS